MIDTFVLLAPVYLLGVMAILGFVGCKFKVGIAGDPEPLDGPVLRFKAGDQAVNLDWDAVTDATEYHVKRGDTSGSLAGIGNPVIPPTLTFNDPGLTNGKHYFYAVSAQVVAGMNPAVETLDSNIVDALPLGSFVTSFTQGTTAAPGTAWVGMAIRVGTASITVHKLGRAFELGLSQPHQMRLVDAATNADVGTATVDMSSETVDRFKYAPLAQGVVLNAGGLYYVLSEETSGGDPYFDQDTIVSVRTEATVPNAVYSTSPGLFVPVNAAGHAYGPVSFQY